MVIVSAQVQSFGFGFIGTWIGLGLGLDKKNYLCHIDKRLPHTPAVLLEYPLFKAFTPHQMKHAVLQPDERMKRYKLY